MITLTIDGIKVTVAENTTILAAANSAGIRIPALCTHKRLNPIGSCRICVVEVEGYANPMTACTTPVIEGISVVTNSERIQNIRKESLRLILVNHPLDCPVCDKGGECTVQNLVYEFGIETAPYQLQKVERRSLYATPLIRFWPDRCIMCLRCVAACRDIKALGAIDVSGCGYDSQISPVDIDKCESCGECLRLCPTGALTENLSRVKGRPWMTKKVETTCAYCGCGCQLELNVLDERIIGITTRECKGTNRGSLCVKGRFGYEFINSEERLTKPLIKKDGQFHEATWDQALNLVAEKFSAIKASHGPDAVAGLASARCTNEENYLMQKFMRAAIGTNNIDQCARLCHSSTVAGLAIALGSGAMTNPIADVLKSETILVTGSNTTDNHPIFADYIREAVFRKGANLIVVDPCRIDLVDYAHVWLAQRPGADIAWINGLIHIILKENLHAADYIRERTEGFAVLEKSVEKYTPRHVSEITGIPAADLRKAALLYGKARPASILYTMGITQHATGTDTVLALANLAMVCGNIGVEGGGINPLRGQNNEQGACDMGALPDVLPAYQPVSDSESREKFSRAWGVTLSDKPGLTAVEITHAAEAGRVKGIYIVGENPLLSDPDLSHVKAAFERLDFLVVQDIFMTETARAADVVLPSACFAEKDGTFTSSERLVQLVRKAIPAPGDARADWEIVSDLSTRLGYPMNYHNPREIMEEINSLAPIYAGITYAKIEKEAIAWPCPTRDHPGTRMLHKDTFVRGKGLFHAIEYSAPAETPDDEYPLILTTGCVLYHYHTGSMTRIGSALNARCPESLIEIHPADARELGIDSGMMVDVSSRRGKVRVKAKVTDRRPSGTVFMNFHFREAAVNLLTNPALDPASKIPELKVCAVKVEAA